MQFAALHFLRDLFFIRQTNGTVRVSRDAREWSEVEIMSGERVRTLAYGNDRFLALGQSNVYSSFDGYAWEKIAAAPLYGFRMAFGNGRFLLAGQAGMGPATLYTSEDGREWRIGSGGATHMFYGFGFAAGHFYMLDTWGAIHFSTDGMNWSFNRLSNYPLLGFAEGNGVMLIAGGSDVVLQKPRESAATKWLPLKLSGPNVELHFSKESRPVQIEASSDLATWSSIATYNDAPQNALIFRPEGRDAMNFYRARELDFR